MSATTTQEQQMIVTLIALELVDAKSDKFYRVYTVGTELVTQYGRNGTYGIVTRKDQPSTDKAEADAAKAAAAKVAKGYTVTKTAAGEFDHVPTDAELDAWAGAADSGPLDGLAVPQQREQAAVVVTANTAEVAEVKLAPVREIIAGERRHHVSPMLAHNVDGDAHLERLLTSPHWVQQPKLDGDRVMVEVVDGEVKVYGRNGQAKVSNVGAAMLAPFRGLKEGRFVFDGEVVGRTLWLFDLPVAEGFLDSRTATFAERYDVLVMIVGILDAGDVIGLVPTVSGEADKRAALAAAEAGRKEGVMFRRASSVYRAGRSDDLLRHKFVKTLDAVITEVGRDGKSNAVLSVFDDKGELVEVGKASTIGKGRIEVGMVVEVAFLYTVRGGRLYQPRIKRVRTDKRADECSTDQLIGTDTDKSVG